MTEFSKLKNIFEMTEILSDYEEYTRLEIEIPNEEDTAIRIVTFNFDENGDLRGGYVNV